MRLLSAAALLFCSCAAQDEHDHDHGQGADCNWTHPWEWAGVFKASADTLLWSAEKKTGKYADASMKFLVLQVPPGGNLESVEANAEQLWKGAVTSAAAGSTISLGTTHNLQFDTGSWISQFTIPAAKSTLAIFAQHLPAEFESRLHYLVSAEGDEVWSTEERSILRCAPQGDSHDDHDEEEVQTDSQRWGEVILASVLTILPTLLGIGFLACTLRGTSGDVFKKALAPVNCAASGTVFACAVFLLLPEATHLIQGGEVEVAATWGTSVLSGWLIGVVIDHICTLVSHLSGGTTVSVVAGAEKSNAEIETPDPDCHNHGSDSEAKRSWTGIAGPVIFGDMFHNLTDGFVIGTAFKACDPGFAFKITAVTVLHEVPQELADFFVLVNKAGMSWPKATLANFLSGCATLVGALISHGVKVSSHFEGVMLAMGAGVYIYVSTTELGPVVAHLNLKDSKYPVATSLLQILCFILGAVVLGLVLLDHQHCVSGPDDPHAGHNH